MKKNNTLMDGVQEARTLPYLYKDFVTALIIILYFQKGGCLIKAVIIGKKLVGQMNWLFLNHFISCLIILSICCNLL